MHAVLTEEQEMLQATAEQLAAPLRPESPAGLDTIDRSKVWEALADAGLLGLREREAGGPPLASGVEVSLVAEALGAALVPVPYVGTTMAVDLLARAGADEWAAAASAGGERTTVLLGADLRGLARAEALVGAVAYDAEGARWGLALAGDPETPTVVRVDLGSGFAPVEPTDLTRTLLRAESPSDVGDAAPRPLEADALARWHALALAVLCADLAGAMRGTLTQAVEYAKVRVQYDAPIGSFQAIQHLLAEMLVRSEASATTARYAAWAVDALEPEEARTAARVAKAYASAGGQEVCEGSMQVFGGIGQTWEHVAHLYTRRALLGGVVLGDEAHHLDHLGASALSTIAS